MMDTKNQKIVASQQELKDVILKTDGRGLQVLFREDWFNEIFPDIRKIIRCGQGANNHFEGDVAVHTGIVFDNMKTFSELRFGHEPSFVELLAAVIHDFKKPDVRKEASDGSVSFPGHEALAAREVHEIGKKIGLTEIEIEELHYLVKYHGDVHNWPELDEKFKQELKASPWIKSLALLQEADAKACILPGGGHLPVFWDGITG